MSLTARFPVKLVSREQNNNMIFSDPKSNKKMNDRKLEETDAQKANESSKVDYKKIENSSCSIERNSDSPGREETNRQ